jgi:cystathionine gamma-synthase
MTNTTKTTRRAKRTIPRARVGAKPTIPRERGDATRAVRAAVAADSAHGAVMPPIYLSANFEFEAFGRKRKYDYTRSGNPTRDQLAAAVADLERGAGAVVTSTGLAAITLWIEALLRPGDLVVAPHDGYGGTYRLFQALARKQHFEIVYVDQNEAAALDAQLSRKPKLVWIETPSNPLLRIVDINDVARRAKAADALVGVDNTFATPVLQKPILLGADFVVHSTTKYLNGHGDVVGGAIVAADSALAETLTWWANCLGLTGSPFDSYQTLRGLRTLAARMRVHQENALAIADFLASHEAVEKVWFPGFATGRERTILERQQNGFGAMLSFELRGGAPAAERCVNALRCFTLAESLGGVESLVAHPATMTHASMDPAARARAGITDGLLRLSIGIESTGDLLSDLGDGLDAAVNP